MPLQYWYALPWKARPVEPGRVVLCCAAPRYTECRLASAAEDMLLDDLDANTVDFAPTFDASQVSPVIEVHLSRCYLWFVS